VGENALIGENVRDGGAQRKIARIGAVGERIGTVALQYGLDRLAEFIHREEFAGPDAARKADKILATRRWSELKTVLAGQRGLPAKLHLPGGPGGRGVRLPSAGMDAVQQARNKGAAAEPAVDEPLGFQFGIGVVDGDAVYAD